MRPIDEFTPRIIDKTLDDAGIERYDVAGKILTLEGRVHRAIFRLRSLVSVLNSISSIQKRMDETNRQTDFYETCLNMLIAEHLCHGYEAVMAQPGSPGYEVSKDTEICMKEVGVYGKVSF